MAERGFSCVDKEFPAEGSSDGYLSDAQVEEIFRVGPDLLEFYIDRYYPGLSEEERSSFWLELLSEIARKTVPDGDIEEKLAA